MKSKADAAEETPEEAAESISDALDFLRREADAAGLDEVSDLLKEASATSRRQGARLSSAVSPASGQPPAAAPARARRRRPRVLGAAGVAAAAAVTVIGLAVLLSPAPVYQASFETALGEHETFQLPDESVLRLNTDSRVTVVFSEDQRRIELARGEAHFEVAHAPARPFVVAAGAGTVRAVGTEFNVFDQGDRVAVTVTEGRVEVAIAEGGEQSSPAQAADAGSEILSQGETLEYGDTLGPVSTLEPDEVARRLAWRDGMLDFRGQTLAEVIAEAGRYTATRITIADPELERLPVIAAYIRAGDVDTLLALIEASDGVSVRRLNDEQVQIVAAPTD